MHAFAFTRIRGIQRRHSFGIGRRFGSTLRQHPWLGPYHRHAVRTNAFALRSRFLDIGSGRIVGESFGARVVSLRSKWVSMRSELNLNVFGDNRC